ncbi:peptide-methionine (S)-S-oxide reductase MsrA [Loigolactobacillus backii]|uniref:Peptide methionine sulfoxide reductase MsrA n=1 Tax=Loigolactobacillus backii TaxID=375175 RepID=A0A192GY49_9LACO|nr:peptide-methionine (S)-S-oxide reductase MsrA [Loigolactobacillus backii]ANK61439.1 peptide methionine sulfoxide reductase [Loigolactobacillus backii]MDA5387780.1 peptide-methionine (S)-S-oxide reductase MsrA [Loigolactobacillus backii]MDA5390890.1 peptide-methionine (S)-S-oxide reductase MsrA [Loigolactobacillus backii]PIO84189.1 peptide-methionine (S)-S-oxide reductase [Loigolactobacillus backii]
MQPDQEARLNDVYNLILNKGTRDWERQQLLILKTAVETGNNFKTELARLEANLRPLAVRDNLTPDMTDFYRKITGNAENATAFDYSRHYAADGPNQERAIFAGGCFWCMVEPFETRPGIIAVTSGYTGGDTENPTYDQVIGQYTNHVEAVEIIFDTKIIKYADLVTLFWQIIDPTDDQGQMNDRGNEYRPVIFVRNAQQRKIATASKQQLVASGKYKRPIVTAIEPATKFWPAENFHQEFYKKNRQRYRRTEITRKQFLAVQHLQNKLRIGLKNLKKKH